MTTAKNLFLLFALVSCFALKLVQAQSEDEEYVTCTHDTRFCPCSVEKKVCNFKLTIRETLTFTRYYAEDVRASAGKVWYIDEETGELKPIPFSLDGNKNCEKDYSKCTDPITVDGNSFRTIITVNEQFPGPTLQVHYDQIVSVEVTNLLASEEVTVHWHGIHQRKTPWMDGVHHVSQCGIAPGASFRYIFRAKPAGTHWYHSHTGAQRTDGLFGALIVMENSDTSNMVMNETPFIDSPEEHTMTLLDWQQRSSIDLFTQIHSGIRYFTEFTPPNITTMRPIERTRSLDGGEVGAVAFWSGLINGKGRHPEIPYSKTRLSVFVVDYSKTYRFRVIGAQSLYAFRLSIDGHRMKVIATDGHFVNSTIVDFLIVHSGERYDFLLDTNPMSPGNSPDQQNFMIRGETLEVDITNHTAEAILHYGTEPNPKSTDYEEIESNSPRKSDECEANKNCTALNCPFEDYPSSYGIQCIHVDSLKLVKPNLDQTADDIPYYEADQTIFLNFGFEGASQASSINSKNFKPPSAPLSLVDDNEFMDIETKERCNKFDDSLCDTNPKALLREKCSCMHMIDVSYDQSVQIVFTATGPNSSDLTNFLNAHPVHLHGHSFHVVKIGFGEYDENGKLTRSSTDTECTGNFTCVNGNWRENPFQGLEGKIPDDKPLKDTVLLPAGGYVVVYIKSDNPGFWFLHCHIEVHQLEGMSVVINEAFDQRNPPPEGMRQCGNFTWSIDDFKAIEAGLDPTKATVPTTSTPSPTGQALGLRSSYILLFAFLIIIAYCC